MTGAPFLFGVDLEDVRMQVPGGDRYRERVPETTEPYLDFLRRHRARGTFFTVGAVARAYPDLVRRIVAEGHEVACHSDQHLPLDRLDPARFRRDTEDCLDALAAAGAGKVRGYRAPCFSLTERTRWAYPILKELGFAYSSSVLPARNPLYGWPGFGTGPRLVECLVELPMTLFPWRAFPVPMGGGVYFRTVPRPILHRALRKRERRNEAVLGYLHPYDLDSGQERFAHPGFSRWSPYNWLMYVNRGSVIGRLEMVAQLGFAIRSYGAHAEALRSTLTPEGTPGDGG